MAYKDKDKQREANRQAQQRRRELVRQGTEGGEGMTDAEIDNVYKGMTKEGNVIPDHPLPVILKRGKDINCFADLPPAARLAINTISENEAEHKRRTAIAINYQHATCSMTKGGVKYE